MLPTHGPTLAFDVLGDIDTIPVTEGKASLLLGGPAFETMPRWSPDSSRIAFTSGRDGIETLWTASPDGQDVRIGGGEQLFDGLDLLGVGYGVSQVAALERATHVVLPRRPAYGL